MCVRVCARLPLCFTRVAYISRDGFVCLSGSNVTVAIPLRNRTLLSPVTFDCLQFLLVGRVPLWVHPKSWWKWLRIDRVLADLQAGAHAESEHEEWRVRRRTGNWGKQRAGCAVCSPSHRPTLPSMSPFFLINFIPLDIWACGPCCEKT